MTQMPEAVRKKMEEKSFEFERKQGKELNSLTPIIGFGGIIRKAHAEGCKDLWNLLAPVVEALENCVDASAYAHRNDPDIIQAKQALAALQNEGESNGGGE